MGTGEVWAAKRAVILRSDAIGSCIGVAAFDINNGIGGMAHIMLPGRSSRSRLAFNTKYAEDALADMLFKMTRLGAVASQIQVCLAGGGNVLQDKDDRICAQLIHSVKGILKTYNIPVVAESLGGTSRRLIFFDIEDAAVYYAKGDAKSRLLYKWNQARGGVNE